MAMVSPLRSVAEKLISSSSRSHHRVQAARADILDVAVHFGG